MRFPADPNHVRIVMWSHVCIVDPSVPVPVKPKEYVYRVSSGVSVASSSTATITDPDTMNDIPEIPPSACFDGVSPEGNDPSEDLARKRLQTLSITKTSENPGSSGCRPKTLFSRTPSYSSCI